MDPLFLPLLLIAGLALLSIRSFRQQKRVAAEARRLQSSLVDGDRVVTISGLHATVVDSAREETVDLEIAPGVRTRWVRAAIRDKLTEPEPLTGDHADPAAIDGAPADGSSRADKS